MGFTSDGIPIIGGDGHYEKKPALSRSAPDTGSVRMEKSRLTAPPPTSAYYPTLMYVACAKCKGVGTIYFPQGFDYKIGDKIMDQKVFKAKCEIKCFEETEMVPIGIKQAMEDLPGLLRRYYMDLQRLILEGSLLSPDDLEFGRVYEKLYGIDGYPPNYDIPTANFQIPEELKNLLIRKGAAGV
jgi:hypothetical protein